MNAINPKKIRTGYQPIPGYTLEEMVGRGGFGEVWRADAPGGLKKAVKFVFGAQDQSRACRELRSLERIKGVHHPFLLTLERFEIVDDQLVIVTELADGSLEDVYKRHRENGSCGIPRDLLVSHLHDAADALDYLHQSYQLQHLDIKPGNLLMVGGHVKVADFGLLKDLTEAECSLVGGLTPIYAPPEVFDGRPSMHSDQYSLAVMYQELLTGTRPFSGRTIAQLATQHVHSAPNLEPLPPADRPVAARALEKNPARRFPNCKEFVEALHNPRHRKTVVVVDAEVDGSAAKSSEEDQVQDLPQLNGSSAFEHLVTNHALVVALGGTGAECLRDLRGRVADLLSTCPVDLHGVLIDTDISTIHSMRVAEASTRIPPCRTIHIPLRSPQEYRQLGTERLQTISRRWIYNVPRSRSTEGMRPLGRLALVDHGPTVTKELSDAIGRLAKSTGDQTPTVYVIGSIAGGTSSGIYLDVAHLLRHLLDEAGLEETRILSLLSTAELRADPATPLALHDSHAAMIEMEHYMSPGNGYPGDVGAGFPSVPAARTPLHDVYLVAPAPRTSLSPPPSRAIADYVWTDATGGGGLLAAARAQESDESETSVQIPMVRSVGVVSLGISRSLEQRLLVPATVRHLMIRWLGLPSRARKAAVTLADRLSRRCAVSREAFGDATRELLGNDDSEREVRVFECLDNMPSGSAGDADEIGHTLRALLQQRCGAEDTDLMIESVMANLVRELTVSLHDQRIDITTAIESIKLIIDDMEPKDPAQSEETEADLEVDSDTDHVDADPIDEPAEVQRSPEMQIFDAIVDQFASERLSALSGRLVHLQTRLESFATALAMAIVQVTKDQPTESNPWDEMPEPIRVHFEPTLLRLHELAVSRWLLRPLGDSKLAAVDVSEMVNELWEESMPLVSEIVDHKDCDYNQRDATEHLASSAMTATLQLSGSVVKDSTLVTQPLSPNAFSEAKQEEQLLPVGEAMEAVRPPLLACGGSQRLILVVGTETERLRFEPEVRQLHPSGLTVALIPESAPRLVHEAQKIELTRVLDRMKKLNGNSPVTGRLLTRTDVSWQT
jgi:serine/threonine protein kinase